MLLDEAIAELERGGAQVFYSSDLIKPWSRVTVEPHAAEPEAALREILAPHGLTLQPGPERTLLIVRDASDADSARPTGGIAGIVRRTRDGAPLAGAVVSVQGEDRRAVTGRDGRFAFHGLGAGAHRLAVLYPLNAFTTTAEVGVESGRTARVDVGVDAASETALEEVVVAASQYQLARAPGASHALLTGEEIERLPDLGDDALRAIARLPGAASNGVSARSNVRGGEVGETLVRFDGLRLYNPYHLKNFQTIFSTVDPRLVRSIDVYTGGFPATYGDRMSSVVDIVSLSPPEDRYHEIGLSFFNTSLLSAGRLDGGEGEWVASVRRSNLDVLFDAHSAHLGQPQYLDAFGKLAHDVGDSLRVSANVLYFADEIALADADGSREARAKDDERYFWLRLDHDLGPRLSGATLIARSRLTRARSGRVEEPGVSTGWLRDDRDMTMATLRSDWLWRRGERLLLRFGGYLRRSRARYAYDDEARFDLLLDDPGAAPASYRTRRVRAAPSGAHYGAYASLRSSPVPRLTAELGLRWDRQTLDADHTSTWSPRIGLRYRIGERTFLRGSLGRYYQSQAINELQAEDGVEAFHAPQRSDHVVIGLEHTFSTGVSLRVETYVKRMRRLRPRFENLLDPLALLPELKPDRIRIAPEGARARGVELMLSQQLAYPLTWWLGYSRSEVTDTIAGRDVPRSWDQTDALSAGIGWDTDRWNVSLGLLSRSGWPTTRVTLDDSGTTPVAEPGPRNAERIGAFRTLDLRVTRKLELESSRLAVFLEINNLLDRDNPCCIEYEILDEEEGGGLELKQLDYLPRIPSLGFVWQF